VSRRLSSFSAAWTSHFIRRAAVCRIFPLSKKEARFTINFHVPSLTQSFPGALFILGSTHLAANALKVVVFASYGPIGRDSGNFWHARR
jgi:hypothetical protein